MRARGSRHGVAHIVAAGDRKLDRHFSARQMQAEGRSAQFARVHWPVRIPTKAQAAAFAREGLPNRRTNIVTRENCDPLRRKPGDYRSVLAR